MQHSYDQSNRLLGRHGSTTFANCHCTSACSSMLALDSASDLFGPIFEQKNELNRLLLCLCQICLSHWWTAFVSTRLFPSSFLLCSITWRGTRPTATLQERQQSGNDFAASSRTTVKPVYAYARAITLVLTYHAVSAYWIHLIFLLYVFLLWEAQQIFVLD